ncbi:DHH family phosphoesterase [Salisediminibacterium beveridgei]|uniref:Cyclic-di-AMP phosphodiesterase n=1 Tax=Salisediminibacterium beveridgei TaxID=632773 RepID=A0A1D7QQZ8_9BACI|nr:DHH family phosphoesterase [Salisediminibacterium beveridgei]AOM81426.1 Phosphoesterase, DHH family protein [Salisediminibacterium beveridgei]
MPNFLMKRWHGYHVVTLVTMTSILSAILTFYQWQLGLIAFIAVAVIIALTIRARNEFEHDLSDYISTLSYRVNKAGEQAFTRLPLGIILYNEEYQIQWANPFMNELLKEQLTGTALKELSSEVFKEVKEQESEIYSDLQGKDFRIIHLPNERLLYFFDATEELEYKFLYEMDKTVIGLIFLDNLDEVTRGLEDQVRSKLLSHVTDSINKWAKANDILIRRTSSDRFIAIMTEETLESLEESKFVLLDEVRERTHEEKVALTLSIGIGSGEDSLREMGALAQSSLDLALGRGGDQVAIKERQGKVRFYGGKTNAVEKRTRVRARVISHAIRDFIKESDQVYIMGHKNPDMDSIGSAIGMAKIVETNGKEAFIVIDPDDMNHNIRKLLGEMDGNEQLWPRFIKPSEAREHVTEDTLLVVVDTHKPSLVVEPRLIEEVERTIVIDHHRRGEEFINDAVLVYMEPYASSAAELVTELLEYQTKNPKLGVLESTALLAGIIVDTKSFAIRTGARTFDAASYLRSRGADTVLVQKLLKEDLAEYVKRAKLVENAYIYSHGMAIAKGAPDATYNQVIIAQAADTLLTMNDVVASFVISKLKDGRVSISARSLGDVNVQVMMEKLDGGGHLTNAATQIESDSLEEVEGMLKKKIDEYFNDGGDES